MLKILMKTGLLATSFALALSVAQAQQIIHAVSGTVRALNPNIQMLEVTTDDGSSGHFRWLRKSDGPIQFDKTVSAEATPPDKLTTTGNHIIVYYFGDDTVRTVVAVRDLGAGSVAKETGMVVKMNRKDRLLTIKNPAGTEESFHLDPKTVADGATGVTQGIKTDLSKGDQVRVTSSPSDDGPMALLIVAAV
jgi:hypothetical protein